MSNGIFSDDINEQKSELATLKKIAGVFISLITIFSVIIITTGYSAPAETRFIAMTENKTYQKEIVS